MINEARTLLLNVNGPHNFSVPGEEVIPAKYRAVQLPGYLQTIRRALLGTDDDRVLLNYRVHQLMTMLHATRLSEYIRELDPRVTYWPAPRHSRLFLAETFGVRVDRELTNGDATLSIIQNENQVPPAHEQRWFVNVLSADTVQVERDAQYHIPQEFSYSLTDGLSGPIPLPNSNLQFRLSGEPVGSTWWVLQRARPDSDLADRFARLQSTLGEDTLGPLFGSPLQDPYKTFDSCWRRHAWMPYRLGGLVLALIYRTKELSQRS